MPINFVTAIDLLGTFAFAISGATAGVRKGLDLFGVLVLAFAAATAGGIVRDALLGATPPVALVDPRYFAVSAAAALITFYRFELIERLRNPVQLSDAVGLGLFAVLGTGKALAHGVGPLGAVMRELYAVAALLGALIVVAGDALELPAAPVAAAGALACFTLRFFAMRRGWQLPVAMPRR